MKYYYTKQKVDSDLLLAQINASLVINSVVSSINWTAPDKLEIDFVSPIAQYEKVELDSIVSNHTVNMTLVAINTAIIKAMEFGKEIVREYAVTRVLRGTTDVETLQVLQELSTLQGAMLSGSLKAARLMLMSMQPTALIPQSDIDYFLAKINKYLGIP